MAETENKEQENKKDYVIIVNGQEFEVEDKTVTFEHVVNLAYPTPPSPDSRFTVTFFKAHKPKEGTLKEGVSVDVKKKDTVFNVKPTVKS
jgi:hypothetical protein